MNKELLNGKVNHKITNKMNRQSISLSIHKRKVFLVGIIITVVAILFSVFFLGTTVTAQRNKNRQKLIASLEIQHGDTLWSIASHYITEEYHDMNEYIKEIKTTNKLTSDTIQAGNFIIVPYFTDISSSLEDNSIANTYYSK